MKKTMQNFIKSSNIDAKLIRAVVRQSGGWVAFQEMAHDIVNHGIAGGFSGWIYYTETCQFYAKNQSTIVALVDEWADECDISPISFVGGFNCIDANDIQTIGKTLYGNKRQHDTQVANALAWFAAEEVACSLVNSMEQ